MKGYRVEIDGIRAIAMGDESSYRRDGEYLFHDRVHYSVAGSAFAVRSFFPYR